MTAQHYDMTFMDALAPDANRVLSEPERRILGLARAGLDAADAVVIHIGGKSGRLGEAIIGTAFVEGILHTLATIGKAHTPLVIIVDSSIIELMPVSEYRGRYWPEIEMITAAPGDVDRTGAASYAGVSARNILALDFHGEHDGMPSLTIAQTSAGGQFTSLASLNRVALRSYAARGPEQRYAAFFRDLFRLPEESHSGDAVQPHIYITSSDAARYPQLARDFGLDAGAALIVCFFQSVVAAKCYERWDEVMAIITEEMGRNLPGWRATFFVACGPDTSQPVHQEDLAAILGGFTGYHHNAQVIVATTPSLLDLAVILRRASLALSNDTGPGHLAGALAIPTVTSFLPGTLYSRQVWASTLWHTGVTIDPSPYSFEDLKAAVFASRTDFINTIPPEHLAAAAIRHLQERV